MVWLGVFNDLVWFRFEAGHSHTEIADRLFSLMKRLFETDSASRVRGVADFARLEEELSRIFQDCPEELMVEYNFANWDFDAWLRTTSVELGGKTIFDSHLAKFSFDHVFRYEYVGSDLARHGGVKVTYKDRLSRRATGTNCEWSPIEEVVDASGTPVGTRTKDGGVIFIPRPPDLRAEPPREPFDSEDAAADLAKGCKAVLTKRHNSDLDDEARCRWLALQNFHAAHKHAGHLPDMPCDITASHGAASVTTSLNGSPCPLLPILKDMRRFERPLITWDPFVEAPPSAFPVAPVAAQCVGSDTHFSKFESKFAGPLWEARNLAKYM